MLRCISDFTGWSLFLRLCQRWGNPKNADAIAASLAQIAEKENARKAREEFLERIKTNALLPEDRIMMRDVEMVALGTAENSKTMRELNIESTPEKAHSLLLKTGVWNEFMDPWPSRMEIETGDPESDLPELPGEERVDLTYMTALAIDDADSHDPDDAISFADGLLWVHVADPAAIVTPESELDNERLNAEPTSICRSLSRTCCRAKQQKSSGLDCRDLPCHQLCHTHR